MSNFLLFCIQRIHIPSNRIVTVMAARMSMNLVRTLVNILTLETVCRQDETFFTLTFESSNRIDACPVDAWRVQALVDVVTVELILSENEAIVTGTLVGAFNVDANLLTIIQIFTLIEIDASMIIGFQNEASLARACMRSNQIDTDIATVAIIFDALVNVNTRDFILTQLVTITACACVASICVRAVMIASVE